MDDRNSDIGQGLIILTNKRRGGGIYYLAPDVVKEVTLYPRHFISPGGGDCIHITINTF